MVLKEALQRGELEALGHLATTHVPCDCLTKSMDPKTLVDIMATNKWSLYAKDTDRVAHSYRMTISGPTAHTYNWGSQGVEPELGTSGITEPVFATSTSSGSDGLIHELRGEETSMLSDLLSAQAHNDQMNRELAVLLEETELFDVHADELERTVDDQEDVTPEIIALVEVPEGEGPAGLQRCWGMY